MNDQLIKFIELCLADGVISEKERAVIFRKAAEYNVPLDECEIILESMIQQKSINNNSIEQIRVAAPRFNLGGYKQIISIGSIDGKERNIELALDNEDSFNDSFQSALSIGFNFLIDCFLNTLHPKDEYVMNLINKYSENSENRRIKKYPNGDCFEGKIINDKANGFGVLNILRDDLIFGKNTQYIGVFKNDMFLNGRIVCFNSEEETDNIKFEDVELIKGSYNCSSISYPNGDKYEGEVVSFKKHGRGKLLKNSGEEVEGIWNNDELLTELKGENELLQFKDNLVKQFKDDLVKLYKDKKYKELISAIEKKETIAEDVLRDSNIADKYLWSLYQVDLTKAFGKIDYLLKVVDDTSKLQDSIGVIYKHKGDETDDLDLLYKALECFQIHHYSDLEFRDNRIKKLQDVITKKKINLYNNTLKELGFSSDFIDFYNNNNYTKIWKVSCYLSEPVYLRGNIKIEKWIDSNITFHVPSVGQITKRNAVAFIKANWSNYEIFISDKSWKSKGAWYDSYTLWDFDRRKIEIIELLEINIDLSK
jgi:hypothetical protein